MDPKKEEMAFDELKKRMKGDMEKEMYEDDNMFWKFLKAREFKVDNAEGMLRQHLVWREKYDVKNISKWNVPEVVKKYFALTKLGYDKEGCIVKYNNFGETDYRGIFQSCTTEDWLKSILHYFEEDVEDLKKQTEKLGKIVDKVVYIGNCEHFSLGTATDKKVISNVATSVVMYLNNYPETLKTAYLIKAPGYFQIFFSILKPFLPSTVLKKIKIYSDDSWKTDILEEIDAEELPAFLGGNQTDPDENPLCLKLIPTVEPVPKSYYLKYRRRSINSLLDGEMISVPRSSLHEVAVEIEEPGCYLEWSFAVKSGDIRFGLYYKDKEDNKTELLPLEKISTQDSVESGVYKCIEAGCYILTFDNSYSYLRSKEIYFKTKTKSPDQRVSIAPF